MQHLPLRLGAVLAFPLACLLLAACTPTPIVRTETVRVNVPVIQPVPPALTAPVPVPVLAGSTNADLAAWAFALKQALEDANARLKAIAGIGATPPAER